MYYKRKKKTAFGKKLLNVVYVGSFFHILTQNPYTNMEKTEKDQHMVFEFLLKKDKMQQSESELGC